MLTIIPHSNNLILKKTYLHYQVRYDQLRGSSDFILIIFLKLFLSAAGLKTCVGGHIK